MPALLDETLFSEPSGRPVALVQLCGALLLSGVYGYTTIVENHTPDRVLLFLISGMALSGVAESLPTPRRRTAGVLRLLAVLVLVGFLALGAVAPGVLAR